MERGTPMAVRQPALITADEFEAFLARPENCNWNYELINGVIIEKMWRTWDRAVILTLVAVALGNFTMPKNLGIPGIKRPVCLPGDPYNYRFVDVSVVLSPDYRVNAKGPCTVMPEVIAEIKPTTESNWKLRHKAHFYLSRGAQLVWLIFPGPRRVEVYRPETPVLTLNADDTLDGYDVLPGFSVPVRQLFPETHGG
jgi:Uma2 family endonuclease